MTIRPLLTIAIAITCGLLLASTTPAFALKVTEVGAELFDADVERLVDDMQGGGLTFTLDMFIVEHDDLATTPLTLDEAAFLMAILDLHVELPSIAETELRPVYDRLVDAVMELSPSPMSELRNLRTLGRLFADATGGSQTWQVFSVSLPDGPVPVDTFFAIHRPTGRLVVMELASDQTRF